MHYGRRNQDGDQLENHVKDLSSEPPELVQAVTRMKIDVLALRTHLDSKLPNRRFIRGRKILMIRYAFGDASGTGFGPSWTCAKKIQVQTWSLGIGWSVREL